MKANPRDALKPCPAEGLVNLSLRRLQKLLEDCHSVKVKGLFFFADRHGHVWLTKLERTRIDLGKGKRMLVRGGKLDPTYDITLPEDLDVTVFDLLLKRRLLTAGIRKFIPVVMSLLKESEKQMPKVPDILGNTSTCHRLRQPINGCRYDDRIGLPSKLCNEHAPQDNTNFIFGFFSQHDTWPCHPDMVRTL